MKEDVEKVLISEEEIVAKVAQLAEAITETYNGEPLTVIALSNGALIFAADLIRRLPMRLQFDNIMVSSYQGTESTGKIKILSDLKLPVAGRHVLIVDDILDTGRTLKAVKDNFLDRNALDIKICVFLDKPSRRVKDITADFIGFSIDDEFVIGYGLDYDEMYRNLPYIGVIKQEAVK